MILSQGNLFLIFVVNGFLIGLFFDIFRILRKSFKTSDIMTTIEDILFWIITGFIILYSIFIFNNGEIRFFMFIGILIGVIFYMILLSGFVIKTSVSIITFLKRVLRFIFKVLILPIIGIYKIIKNLLKKPILFCFINLKKIIRQFSIKFTKINLKKQKK